MKVDASRFSKCALLITSILMFVGAQNSIAQSLSNTLKPFATDGCSVWIDGTISQLNAWRHCCVAHDIAYWKGGAEELRTLADDEFHSCLKISAGNVMADYMYNNVRWAGSPYWATPYRWGYGWNYLENTGKPRGYKIPTPEEQKQIDTLMPAAEKNIADDLLSHPPK